MMGSHTTEAKSTLHGSPQICCVWAVKCVSLSFQRARTSRIGWVAPEPFDNLRGLVGGHPALTGETLKAWRLRGEQTGAEPASSDKPVRPRLDSRIFRLTNEAVIYVDPDPDREPLTICGRLDVVALTRDAQGNGWGRLLRWADSQGRVHEWAMPMSLLAGDGSEYRARLLDGGLFIAPGRKQRELLTVYLQTAKTETRVLSVERIGWHQNSFVLPGATIGPSGTEGILFQAAFEADHHLNMSGTHEEWRQHKIRKAAWMG